MKLKSWKSVIFRLLVVLCFIKFSSCFEETGGYTTISIEKYLTIGIMYPTKVAMLQSAANWSRVAEPLVPIDFNKSLRFSLSKDTPDIFGVTSRTAVVYVKDAEKLSAYAPGSVFRISVLASKHTFKGAYAIEFNVQLKKAEKPTCSNNMHDNMDNFCSKFKSRNQCESSCGVGSPDGRCKWRQGLNEVSKFYSTCSPDLKSCSDSKCDALEFRSFRSGALVCPQDCLKNKHIANSTLPSEVRGIGWQNSSVVCSCDGPKKCECEDVANITSKKMEESESFSYTKEFTTTPGFVTSFQKVNETQVFVPTTSQPQTFSLSDTKPSVPETTTKSPINETTTKPNNSNIIFGKRFYYLMIASILVFVSMILIFLAIFIRMYCNMKKRIRYMDENVETRSYEWL